MADMKKTRNNKAEAEPVPQPEKRTGIFNFKKVPHSGAVTDQGHPLPPSALDNLTKPTAAFTQALANEIVKNLASLGQLTTRPFRKSQSDKKAKPTVLGVNPVLLDTSILIDGRIVPIVNSGFFSGTMIIPQFVMVEVQHIADSSDIVRRTKGRRGLDVAAKLKNQKNNILASVKLVNDDPLDVNEVDLKLLSLAKKWKKLPEGKNIHLMTVDFNLAQLARAQGIKVLNINDLAQALKIALVPGEELNIHISHAGKEREQGVGYLEDGTMVVVDNAKDKVGSQITVVVTKVHQTPAGQLFFACLK